MREYFYKWVRFSDKSVMSGTDKAKLLREARRSLNECFERSDYKVGLATNIEIYEKEWHKRMTGSDLKMRGVPKQVHIAVVAFENDEAAAIFKLKFM